MVPGQSEFSYDALFSTEFPSASLTTESTFQNTHNQPIFSLSPAPSDTLGGDDSDTSSQSEYARESKRKRRDLPCLEPSCSRTFMNTHTRQKHMQTHRNTPKRSFPCTIAGCSEQFSRQHDRFRHEVVQHGVESKWTCTKCHGFFSSERSRSSHKCTKGGRWKVTTIP